MDSRFFLCVMWSVPIIKWTSWKVTQFIRKQALKSRIYRCVLIILYRTMTDKFLRMILFRTDWTRCFHILIKLLSWILRWSRSNKWWCHCSSFGGPLFSRFYHSVPSWLTPPPSVLSRSNYISCVDRLLPYYYYYNKYNNNIVYLLYSSSDHYNFRYVCICALGRCE